MTKQQHQKRLDPLRKFQRCTHPRGCSSGRCLFDPSEARECVCGHVRWDHHSNRPDGVCARYRPTELETLFS